MGMHCIMATCGLPKQTLHLRKVSTEQFSPDLGRRRQNGLRASMGGAPPWLQYAP